MNKNQLNLLRELFIRRMTVDSETTDRRRKDFNQAIFHIESNEDVDEWNAECEKYVLQKKGYGSSYPVWSETTLDMVLTCFDNAVKDYLKEQQKEVY